MAFNQSIIHPSFSLLLMKPFEFFSLLVRTGQVQNTYRKVFGYGLDMVTEKHFWKSQHKLIEEDLEKCNKSAWVLPGYLGHQIARTLKTKGKHSDVGINALNRPHLIFIFTGLVPISIYNRASCIANSNLLEWWQGLINKTHLVSASLNEPPTEPNMSGSIQLIFMIIGSGLLLASTFLFVELRKKSYYILKISFYFGYNLIRIHLYTVLRTIRQLVDLKC